MSWLTEPRFNNIQLATYTINLVWMMMIQNILIGLINAGILFFTFLTVKTYIRNLISNMWTMYCLSGVECRTIELEIMRLMEIWHVKWEQEQKNKNEIEMIRKRIKKRLEKNG